ncbi:MAG TPA: agmatine deiminase family protein [Ignavibacteria bacterium]|nr:agmatine deiminase family protein [Ignavibacteria bacterium]
MTGKEKELYKTYEPIFSDFTDPPPTPVRTMSEWEEFQGILITWTSYTTILRQMVDYAQDEGLVFIVCSDSSSVKSFLTSGGVPLVNLKFLITSFNSVWSRDYGPWSAYSGVADSLKIVDWVYNRPRPLDDVISVYFANYANLPIYQATQAPNDLISPGGNFLHDGNGTAFSSKLVLDENPTHTEAEIDTLVRRYNGIKRYIKMNTLPYDGIHHIDMHMKVLDEETLLVGQYPTGVSDGPFIEANLQYILNNFPTCYGRPYKVVRIPMPPSLTGQYPPSSSYYTYTNSLFVNKTMMVPIYGFPQDTTALRIYRENLPGYRVVGINCSSMISAGGALHCIAKEIGAVEPIFISHAKLYNTNNTVLPYEVKAYIKTKSNVSGAKVYWSTDTSVGFNQLTMTALASDTFRTFIPAQPLGANVYYYITANSNSGRTISKPLTAPGGFYQFRIDNPTVINNGQQVYTFALNQNYPNPFNPSTSIGFEIPAFGFVKLKVYDLLGKEIATLINEAKHAGNYKVKFSDSDLSAGIYFYRLEVNNMVEIKKMILLK